jgi:hypothetical protein
MDSPTRKQVGNWNLYVANLHAQMNPFSGSKMMYFGIFLDECGFTSYPVGLFSVKMCILEQARMEDRRQMSASYHPEHFTDIANQPFPTEAKRSFRITFRAGPCAATSNQTKLKHKIKPICHPALTAGVVHKLCRCDLRGQIALVKSKLT